MDSKNIIEIKELTKEYRIYKRNVSDRLKDIFLPGKKRYSTFTALDKLDLTVKRGEILGIIGRNGAGKSTLLKIISGIIPTTSGSVEVGGNIVPLLELGGGFNPEFTGRENIFFYCSLMGMEKGHVDSILDDIIQFSELGEFIDVPIKKYSSGMRARLAFSVSINIDPEILILDEVLSVGDELFKRKCFTKMEEFFNSGKTILFVTHSLQSIINICTRAVVLHEGKIILDAEPVKAVNRYRDILSGIDKGEDKSLNKNQFHERGNIRKKESFLVQVPRNTGGGDSSFFEKGFLSKTVKIVKNKDIDITGIRLHDSKGKDVNNIKSGDRLCISLRVILHEAASSLSAGVVIYTDMSKNITGIYCPIEDNGLGKDYSNREYKFKFTASLAPGVYFARAVVRGDLNGLRQPLSIVQDALVFRVFENRADYEQVTESVMFSQVDIGE